MDKEYVICDTCKGNHFERTENGYTLCSDCKGVETIKESTLTDTGHRG